MANFKQLDNIYFNVNNIIDDLLELQNKLSNKEKIKHPLLLQICELEKQLTEINILRLDELYKNKNN